MPSISSTPSRLRILTPAEVHRLQRYAPLFDIYLSEASPGPGCLLRVVEKTGTREVVIQPKDLPLRLLTEVCAKLVRWVWFHHDEPCNVTLAALPDSKLDRLAVLYAKWRLSGFPE